MLRSSSDNRFLESLANIARIFELEANSQLPPQSKSNSDVKKDAEIKENYWQDFFGKAQTIKINFKNCLLVIGRHIAKIIIPIEQQTKT